MVAIVVAGSKAEVAGCHDRLTQHAQRHLADDNLRIPSCLPCPTFRCSCFLHLLAVFPSCFHTVFRFYNLTVVIRFLFPSCLSVFESSFCLSLLIFMLFFGSRILVLSLVRESSRILCFLIVVPSLISQPCAVFGSRICTLS